MQKKFQKTGKQILSGYAFLLLLMVFSGCNHSSADAPSGTIGTGANDSEKKLNIVCTIAMITDMVKNIAGEHANVIGIMGEDVDPHMFQPQRDSINKIHNADIVFYCGLNLEGQMSRLFGLQASKGKNLFAVTAGIDQQYLRKPEGAHGHYDPHLWPDVSAWSKCAQYIADRLSELDPAHSSEYQKNCESYREQLTALDTYIKERISSIPESTRYLVTAHDAFGYFSRAYEIPVRSVQGISTESEAGVQDINKLVDFLASQKIPAIFVESSTPKKNIEAVIEGVKAKGFNVKVGGELFSDAMGQTGTYEGTYIGMMDHNATIITRALGGDAPEKGLNGKLNSGSPE